jgi:hypothetical protein
MRTMRYIDDHGNSQPCFSSELIERRDGTFSYRHYPKDGWKLVLRDGEWAFEKGFSEDERLALIEVWLGDRPKAMWIRERQTVRGASRSWTVDDSRLAHELHVHDGCAQWFLALHV